MVINHYRGSQVPLGEHGYDNNEVSMQVCTCCIKNFLTWLKFFSHSFWLADQLSKRAMLLQDLIIFKYTTSCVVSNRYNF